jgi:hypothetical protein
LIRKLGCIPRRSASGFFIFPARYAILPAKEAYMPTAELIYQEAKTLPEDLLKEVWDFMRFIARGNAPSEPNAPRALPKDEGETHQFTTMEDARAWYAAAKDNDCIQFQNADDALAWLYDDDPVYDIEDEG